MNMKKILAFILSLMILVMCAGPVYATKAKEENGSFTDVPPGHWAYEAIRWMFVNKIVEGSGGGKFLPSNPVSRDEYAKMMVLTLKLTLINPENASFLDIKKGGWQYKYVETAKPYLTGFRTDSGDYFRPSAPAVREDMAVALVKALGFGGETADLNVLAQFDDASSISPNLKKYVAIAVKHNLMVGYDKEGKRVFGPAEGLTRAEAAVLLYNAFKENEEKITYDEEKVTYENGSVNNNDDDDEDEDEDNSGNEPASSNITVKISGEKAVVEWDKIMSSKFRGYKVVISQNDSTPEYPENGYLKYITDRDTTSITVKAGDCYHGGDFDGKLKSGVEYYFSITVLYDNGKAAGNAVKVKIP